MFCLSVVVYLIYFVIIFIKCCNDYEHNFEERVVRDCSELESSLPRTRQGATLPETWDCKASGASAVKHFAIEARAAASRAAVAASHL